MQLDTIQQEIAILPPDAQQIIFDLVSILKKRYSSQSLAKALIIQTQNPSHQFKIRMTGQTLLVVLKPSQICPEIIKPIENLFK